MELKRYRKPLRTSDEEAASIVQGIPSLRTMFAEFGDYKGDLFGDRDTTNGIMYLSRLNPENRHFAKKSNADPDRDVGSVHSENEEESKSVASKHMSSATRIKKRRFAMALSTLSAKPNKRLLIVNEGAIFSLIELSSINDNPIRRCCASAFASLSYEKQLRMRMIEEGAFGAIISLAVTASKSAKADCCRAICNLCCENGYEYRAIKEGVPYTLVQIAQSQPENTTNCLKALLNITCITDKIPRLEEVTDALMHFTNFILDEDQDALILAAICNMSALRNNQLRLVEDGCLRVVEKANRSFSRRLRSIASEIVRNLTTDSRTRSKLIDQNIINILLVMAKDELEVVKTSCVHAFYNLSRDMACREKIVSGNAVTVIIRMSMEKISNVDMGRTASKTLRILCCDRYLAHKLVADGIVKALMSLIKTDDGTIRQYCAESICSLFQNEDVLLRLIEQGAVNVLVSLSQNNSDQLTGEWCAFALYHLATNERCPVTMLAYGILPSLIRLCDASSARTKKFCASAIWSITMKKAVDASTSIPVLVHMLRHETSQSIKADCASSLYNLADSDYNCDLMLSAGALIPIVRLTKADYLQTKIKCAAILSRLSTHEKYYTQFCTDDVLKVLLELSCLEHALTQRRVVIALSNLTQFPELRVMLLNLKATKYIVALASKPDEHIRRGCSAIICNLSKEEGGEEEMIRADVMDTLLITALVTSDQLETKLICAKAMVNLMCDPNFYELMKIDDVIWGMSSLSLLEDMDILSMCAKALCNLSCRYAPQMLATRTTVNAIMKLLNQEHVELQRDSGRILTNILLQTTDVDEDFRRRAVDNMTLMARCKDKDVSEKCILCLCLASQSESCRASIVSSGILGMLDVSTIFADASISFAYLTMFGNIANNPKMRTQLLDEHSINRFLHICQSHDQNLDLAVMKALYCLSCASENIPKLVDQNSLQIIDIICNTSYEKTPELIHHVLAYILNLTTDTESQCKLVSQGVVLTIYKLWSLAKKSIRTCTIAMLAICHLACGHVNTSQMVDENCSEILCFMTKHKEEPAYASYYFDHDMIERCSAAFRNLCCIIPNQDRMVMAGAITSIVELISLNGESTESARFAQIRQNCASALRSMTYNIGIRQKLLESGAIAVILQDLTRNFEGDKISIGHNLLCELEAESWCNGSRGREKESRAPRIPTAPLYTELLGGTPHVTLNVDAVTVKQDKFLVRVILEEPPIETDGALDALEEGLNNLASFSDSEEQIHPKPIHYPKQECDMEVAAPTRKTFIIHSRGPSLDAEDGAPHVPDIDMEKKQPSPTKSENDDEEESIASSRNDYLGGPRISFENVPTEIKKPSSPTERRGSRSSSPKKSMSRSPSSFDADRFPKLLKQRLIRQATGATTATHGTHATTMSGNEELPKLRTSRSAKSHSAQDFKGLVALINHHAKSKHSNTMNILDKWSEMSKY